MCGKLLAKYTNKLNCKYCHIFTTPQYILAISINHVIYLCDQIRRNILKTIISFEKMWFARVVAIKIIFVAQYIEINTTLNKNNQNHITLLIEQKQNKKLDDESSTRAKIWYYHLHYWRVNSRMFNSSEQVCSLVLIDGDCYIVTRKWYKTRVHRLKIIRGKKTRLATCSYYTSTNFFGQIFFNFCINSFMRKKLCRNISIHFPIAKTIDTCTGNGKMEKISINRTWWYIAKTRN